MAQACGYPEALVALQSLISNKFRPQGRDAGATFAALSVWADRLELQGALRSLRVVHVAGTKGKGSTCAFVERILRENGHTTGLYTSPHLLDVRERVQLNGEPLSEALFASHVWWCFDQLRAQSTPDLGLPPYFYFLTLVALRAFHAAAVDAVVLEVGLGGRWDATNVVPASSVAACGVAALGYDHMELLGHNLGAIAAEKAGIFKPGVPAFSVPQPAEAAAVVAAAAASVGAPLTLVAPLHAAVRLGLAGHHQRGNAALAVALAGAWERRHGGPGAAARVAELTAGGLPASYARGLAEASWPGRCQAVADPAPGSRLAFRLDGAHTGESAAAAAQWFADEATGAAAAAAAAGAAGAAPQQPRQPQPRPPCALVFNCLAEREPRRLMDPLARGLAAARLLPLSAALFVPAGDGAAAAPLGADLAWQRRLAGHWADAVAEAQRQPRACGHGGLGGGGGGTAAPPAAAAGAADAAAAARRGVHVLPSAASAVGWLRRAAAAGALPPRTTVLVTGSLYLVADALRALAPPKV